MHLFSIISRVWNPIYAKKKKGTDMVFEPYTVGKIIIWSSGEFVILEMSILSILWEFYFHWDITQVL